MASTSYYHPIELGLRFQTDTAGYISGIRFYKGTANTGTHTGSLWSANGTLLAKATFTNESTSGWQTVWFDTPVAIQANTPYVASYYAPKGRYAVDANYFAISGLSAVRSMSSRRRRGRWGLQTRPGFPNHNASQSASYGVDVVFRVRRRRPR